MALPLAAMIRTRTYQEMRQQTSTFYDDMARKYFKILNKNSSGDEIANVLVNDDIAHT